jgi:chemotaxis protein CheC
MESLNNFEVDALKEIGSIGMGNATTSLSKLIGKNVRLNLTDARLLDPEVIARSIPESITMIGVMQKMEGGLEGVALLLFEFNNATSLSSLMLRDSEMLNDPDMHESALSELGNILTGAYMSSVYSFLGLEVHLSPPTVSVGPIINILRNISQVSDTNMADLLNIETMFMVNGTGATSGLDTIYGDMFLLLTPDSLSKIQDSIMKMLS